MSGSTIPNNLELLDNQYYQIYIGLFNSYSNNTEKLKKIHDHKSEKSEIIQDISFMIKAFRFIFRGNIEEFATQALLLGLLYQYYNFRLNKQNISKVFTNEKNFIDTYLYYINNPMLELLASRTYPFANFATLETFEKDSLHKLVMDYIVHYQNVDYQQQALLWYQQQEAVLWHQQQQAMLWHQDQQEMLSHQPQDQEYSGEGIAEELAKEEVAAEEVAAEEVAKEESEDELAQLDPEEDTYGSLKNTERTITSSYYSGKERPQKSTKERGVRRQRTQRNDEYAKDAEETKFNSVAGYTLNSTKERGGRRQRRRINEAKHVSVDTGDSSLSSEENTTHEFKSTQPENVTSLTLATAVVAREEEDTALSLTTEGKPKQKIGYTLEEVVALVENNASEALNEYKSKNRNNYLTQGVMIHQEKLLDTFIKELNISLYLCYELLKKVSYNKKIWLQKYFKMIEHEDNFSELFKNWNELKLFCDYELKHKYERLLSVAQIKQFDHLKSNPPSIHDKSLTFILSAIDDKGRTILMFALEYGLNDNIIKKILSAVNQQSNSSLIDEQVGEEESRVIPTEKMKSIVNYVNHKNNWHTVHYLARNLRSPDIVKMFLDMLSLPVIFLLNIRDSEGYNFLDLIWRQQDANIVRDIFVALLEYNQEFSDYIVKGFNNHQDTTLGKEIAEELFMVSNKKPYVSVKFPFSNIDKKNILELAIESNKSKEYIEYILSNIDIKKYNLEKIIRVLAKHVNQVEIVLLVLEKIFSTHTEQEILSLCKYIDVNGNDFFKCLFENSFIDDKIIKVLFRYSELKKLFLEAIEAENNRDLEFCKTVLEEKQYLESVKDGGKVDVEQIKNILKIPVVIDNNESLLLYSMRKHFENVPLITALVSEDVLFAVNAQSETTLHYWAKYLHERSINNLFYLTKKYKLTCETQKKCLISFMLDEHGRNVDGKTFLHYLFENGNCKLLENVVEAINNENEILPFLSVGLLRDYNGDTFFIPLRDKISYTNSRVFYYFLLKFIALIGKLEDDNIESYNKLELKESFYSRLGSDSNIEASAWLNIEGIHILLFKMVMEYNLFDGLPDKSLEKYKNKNIQTYFAFSDLSYMMEDVNEFLIKVLYPTAGNEQYTEKSDKSEYFTPDMKKKVEYFVTVKEPWRQWSLKLPVTKTFSMKKIMLVINKELLTKDISKYDVEFLIDYDRYCRVPSENSLSRDLVKNNSVPVNRPYDTSLVYAVITNNLVLLKYLLEKVCFTNENGKDIRLSIDFAVIMKALENIDDMKHAHNSPILMYLVSNFGKINKELLLVEILQSHVDKENKLYFNKLFEESTFKSLLRVMERLLSNPVIGSFLFAQRAMYLMGVGVYTDVNYMDLFISAMINKDTQQSKFKDLTVEFRNNYFSILLKYGPNDPGIQHPSTNFLYAMLQTRDKELFKIALDHLRQKNPELLRSNLHDPLPNESYNLLTFVNRLIDKAGKHNSRNPRDKVDNSFNLAVKEMLGEFYYPSNPKQKLRF